MHRLLLLYCLCCSLAGSAQPCDLLDFGFENYTTANPPPGWTTAGSYINGGSAHTGARKAGFNSKDDALVSPVLHCADQLCFYWRASSVTAKFDVQIAWKDSTTANWQLLHTIHLDGTASPTAYTHTCIDLPELVFTNGNAQLRWLQSYRSGGSFFLDDICVSSGTCTVTPTELRFVDLPRRCLPPGVPFGVAVCATDAQGFVDQSFGDAIHLTNEPDLQGTTTGTPTNGCVRFTDLRLPTAKAFLLQAQSTTLSGSAPPLETRADCPTGTTLRVMAYNLLNFPNGKSCGSGNHNLSGRADTLRKILAYERPDVLMVSELQTEAGADSVLRIALDWPGAPRYARAAFVPNRSASNQVNNNGFFFNSDKLTLYAQDEVLTGVRDIGKYTLYLNDPRLAHTQDTVFVDFYAAHLKSSDTPTDRDKRHLAVLDLQQHLNSQPAPRNSLIGGDFNLYRSTEAAYQALLGGTYPFIDPGGPGDWDNDPAYSHWHTQATRRTGDPVTNCGIPGGIDSRFDFLLHSGPVADGSLHVQYQAGSFEVVGNEGQLNEQNILAARGASSYPDSVLEALFYSSDHLPVIEELQVQYPTQAALPLADLRFYAARKDEVVALHWSALREWELDHYTVERSADSRHWRAVATVAALNTSPGSYFLTDTEAPVSGAYYRLRAVDWNGTETYSPTRFVPGLPDAGAWQLYPNPSADGRTFVRAPVGVPKAYSYEIYDARGVRVHRLMPSLRADPLPLPLLSDGYYQVVRTAADGRRSYRTLVVNRP